MNRALLCIALLALFLARAPAQTIRNEEHHWSVDTPLGWMPIPDEVLKEMDKLARERLNKPVTHPGGFQTQLGLDGGAPYVLIQHIPGSYQGASYEQIERAFSATNMDKGAQDAASKLTDIVSSFEMGKAYLDRARNRVVSTASITGADGTRSNCLSITFLAANGSYQVNCYAAEDRMEAVRPAFDHVIESFQLDPDSQFRAGRSTSGSYQVGRSIGSLTVLALVGVGIVKGILRMLRRS